MSKGYITGVGTPAVNLPSVSTRPAWTLSCEYLRKLSREKNRNNANGTIEAEGRKFMKKPEVKNPLAMPL
jgi:hypothetical protein